MRNRLLIAAAFLALAACSPRPSNDTGEAPMTTPPPAIEACNDVCAQSCAPSQRH